MGVLADHRVYFTGPEEWWTPLLGVAVLAFLGWRYLRRWL